MQFLRADSHSVGAHTAFLKPDEDSSSEDEHEQAPVPTATVTVSKASTADDCCERLALVPCGH